MTPRWPGTVETLAAAAAFLGFDLVAHGRDGLGVGADEDDAGLLQCRRESLALGQETVAGMDRLGARFLAGRDDLLDDQVALSGRRRTDQDGLVGHLDMERILVGLRINGNRLDPHLPGGLDDPAGDFAAIGDQNAFEHVGLTSPAGLAANLRHCNKMSMRDGKPDRNRQP